MASLEADVRKGARDENDAEDDGCGESARGEVVPAEQGDTDGSDDGSNDGGEGYGDDDRQNAAYEGELRMCGVGGALRLLGDCGEVDGVHRLCPFVLLWRLSHMAARCRAIS